MADEQDKKLIDLQQKVLDELVLIRWFLLFIVVVIGIIIGGFLLASLK